MYTIFKWFKNENLTSSNCHPKGLPIDVNATKVSSSVHHTYGVTWFAFVYHMASRLGVKQRHALKSINPRLHSTIRFSIYDNVNILAPCLKFT